MSLGLLWSAGLRLASAHHAIIYAVNTEPNLLNHVPFLMDAEQPAPVFCSNCMQDAQAYRHELVSEAL